MPSSSSSTSMDVPLEDADLYHHMTSDGDSGDCDSGGQDGNEFDIATSDAAQLVGADGWECTTGVDTGGTSLSQFFSSSSPYSPSS